MDLTPTPSKLAVGDRVVIDNDDAHYEPHGRPQWIPVGTLTGTVQKLFKNGKIAVAVDQIGNQSEDGKHTMHFSRARLSLAR